jgi:hypothetical protein
MNDIPSQPDEIALRPQGSQVNVRNHIYQSELVVRYIPSITHHWLHPLAPLILPPTFPHLTLHFLSLPSVHLPRSFIDIGRLLGVRKADIPIPRWCARALPVVSMPRDRLLVRSDRCLPLRIHLRFFGEVCCTGAVAFTAMSWT